MPSDGDSDDIPGTQRGAHQGLDPPRIAASRYRAFAVRAAPFGPALEPLPSGLFRLPPDLGRVVELDHPSPVSPRGYRADDDQHRHSGQGDQEQDVGGVKHGDHREA